MSWKELTTLVNVQNPKEDISGHMFSSLIAALYQISRSCLKIVCFHWPIAVIVIAMVLVAVELNLSIDTDRY